MNINLKAIVAGAVGGFVAALMVDMNAWSKSGGEFDWGLALKRWIAGAFSGAFSGTGVGAAMGVGA